MNAICRGMSVSALGLICLATMTGCASKTANQEETRPSATAPPPADEPAAGDRLFYQPGPEDGASRKEPYTVVKVFYATDRAATDVAVWQQSLRRGWPTLTGLFAAIAVLLMLYQRRRPGHVLGRIITWAMVALAVLFGGLTLAYRWQPELQDRQMERMYGNGRGQLELGTCRVSVPKDHRVGELESPNVLHLEFREDPERHVVLLGVHPLTDATFYAELRECVEKSPQKGSFVFVHGYNVGFEAAVRRTAQIAYDLKFQGAPIVYSWPSQEGLLSYAVDENNVTWTVPHLKGFLLQVARQSGAKSVHLIAHSMGNRALTSALRELRLEYRLACPKFREVILTAPDIDAEVFARDLAPALVQTAQRVTLYASSNDEALAASRAVHGYRRAGESGDHVVVLPGLDTVDVSEVDTSLIGHSYYGSNTTVLADLFELMHGSKPADQRRWLQSIYRGKLKYWKFLREKLGAPAEPLDGPEL